MKRISGWVCGPKIYKYEGWVFELSASSGPCPLKKNLELRKCAGNVFYSMFEKFNNLTDKEKNKHRIGGGCQQF